MLVLCRFFHENCRFFDVAEIPVTGGSLILKIVKNQNRSVNFKNQNNHTTLVLEP
jgi:hypothetical protein